MHSARSTLRGLVRVLTAIGLVTALLASSTASAFDIPYRRDRDFENDISSRMRVCLPPSDERPNPTFQEEMVAWARASGDHAYYGLRVMYHVFNECLVGNIKPVPLLKYGSLAAAFMVNPGTWAYTQGELASDGMKCVAKAFVESSDSIDRVRKTFLRKSIDTAFSVKDVLSWLSTGVGGARALHTDPDDAKAMQKLFELVHAGYERGLDFQSFRDIAAAAASDGQRYVDRVLANQTERDYLDAQAALKTCHFSDAKRLLAQSRTGAVQACRAAGAQFRQAERELRNYIYEHYAQLMAGRQFAGENPQERTARQKYEHLNNEEKRNLRRSVRDTKAFMAKLDQLRVTSDKRVALFKAIRESYEKQLQQTESKLSGPNACNEISKLAAMVKPMSPVCRSQLWSGEGRRLRSPDDLFQVLNNNSRMTSQDWHRRLDDARQKTEICHLDEAEKVLRGLAADVEKRQLYAAVNGRCIAIDQNALRNRIRQQQANLRGYRAGGNVAIPNLRGVPLSKAKRELINRRLVPGAVVRGSPAPRGVEPGSVERVTPAAGKRANVCTHVALTVYGRHRAVLQEATPPGRPPAPPQPETTASTCGRKLPHDTRKAMWDELAQQYENGRWTKKYKWNDVRTSDIYKMLRDEIINANYFKIHYAINVPIWRARLACFDSCIMSTPKNLQVNRAASRAYRACQANCRKIKYNICDSQGRIERPGTQLGPQRHADSRPQAQPTRPQERAAPPQPSKPVCQPVKAWKRIGNRRGKIGRSGAGVVLHGGRWSNGRLKNGVMDGNGIVSAQSVDLHRGGIVGLKFSANGGGKYMAIYPGVVGGIGGKPLTTHNRWGGSTLIRDGAWLYARIVVKPGGDYRLTVSYQNYNGKPIYMRTGRLKQPTVRLQLSFVDNHAGTRASVTLGGATACSPSSNSPTTGRR